MKYCPDCGKETDGKTPVCPYCGYDLQAADGAPYMAPSDPSFGSRNLFCRVKAAVSDVLPWGKTDTPEAVLKLRRLKKEGRSLVGQTFVFGSVRQGKTAEPTGILWQILAEEDNRVLAISRYGLEQRTYHRLGGAVTWELCSLRRYLNETFFPRVFTAKEQGYIPSVDNETADHDAFGTKGGNPTTDRVFLLNREEALRYFGGDGERICIPTDFAVHAGAVCNAANGACRWWLRTPGKTQDTVCSIGYQGKIFSVGNYTNYTIFAVRPAIWVHL